MLCEKRAQRVMQIRLSDPLNDHVTAVTHNTYLIVNDTSTIGEIILNIYLFFVQR